MRIAGRLFLSVFFAGCAVESYPQDFLPAQEPREDNEWAAPSGIPPRTKNVIIEKISSLPEYKDTDAHIRKITKGKRGASGIIKRDESSGGFIVRVGRGGSDFESYFIFHVDGSTYHIMVYDILNDTFVTLDELRNRGTGQPSNE